MRRTSRFQKLLYLIMLILGIYILYKAGCILLESGAARQALDSGEIQRNLEDAAMRTYAPGYTAAVEGRGMPDWIAKWMQQVVPVYSYLAEGTEEESAQETEPISQAEGKPEETTHREESVKGETKEAGQAVGRQSVRQTGREQHRKWKRKQQRPELKRPLPGQSFPGNCSHSLRISTIC